MGRRGKLLSTVPNTNLEPSSSLAVVCPALYLYRDDAWAWGPLGIGTSAG